MCTVTIVPGRFESPAGAIQGFRMAASRDEQHGRATAIPPRPEAPAVHGDCLVFMPIDPASGGTWVAVNDAGLALTLLNYNLPKPPTGRDRSRGLVIPELAEAASVDDVLALAPKLEADRPRMMPFRFVACDGQKLMLWRGTEPVSEAEVGPWDGTPVMFTSSGLGDHLVEGPRRELFDGWFSDDPDAWCDEQLAFHRHRWPGREHLSVNMHREDARTVSYTTIDVTQAGSTMCYYPDGPDQAEPTVAGTLQRRLARQ